MGVYRAAPDWHSAGRVPAANAAFAGVAGATVRILYTSHVNSSAPSASSPFPADAVLAARRERGLVAVFDFDGTLVNIARSPEAVHMTPRTAARLETLAGRGDTTVGVVSGRPLDSLMRFVNAPSVWLFGLHGWEHREPRGTVVREWPAGARELARRQIDLLARQLGTPQGERIEDKGPIVAVHTRNTIEERREHVERVVRAVQLPEFALVTGRRVLELRPVNGLTKGSAVRAIAATRPGAAILYIGDDTTDEDAFKVLGDEDFAVLVDDEHAHVERPAGAVTHARYSLSGTDAVAHVLDALNAS